MSEIDISAFYKNFDASKNDHDKTALLNEAVIEKIMDSIIDDMGTIKNVFECTQLVNFLYSHVQPNETIQRLFKNREQLISLLPPDEQKKLSSNKPETFLKYTTVKVQEDLCNESPRKYLEHATLDTQKKLCYEQPSKFLSKENHYLKFHYRYDLSTQNDKTQIAICELDPRSLTYASIHIQTDLSKINPERYLCQASTQIQIDLCDDSPNKYLKFADKKIQLACCRHDPHKYVNFADHKVQIEFCSGNAETCLQLASEEVQIELCKKNPPIYLKYASEPIQTKLCDPDRTCNLIYASEPVKKNLLPNASEEIQTSLCRNYPASLLRFASDNVQTNICRDTSMLLFSAKSYINISDAMSASITQCSKSWLSKGKQKKINDLENCQKNYLENPSLDNLKAFMKKASEARESFIREAKPGETKTIKAFIAALSEPTKSVVSSQKDIVVYFRQRFFSKIRSNAPENPASLGINNKPPRPR